MTSIKTNDKYNVVINFVSEVTKQFDESHDVTHAICVYNNTMNIINSMKNNFDFDYDIVMMASLLHDVCDYKYPNSITRNELEAFILSQVSKEKTKIILDIIDNISYSKEMKGQLVELISPYNIYRDVISDADKIEALGQVGINRCITFTRERGGKVPEDVITHCHEKLLRLLPERFIRTEEGKCMAKPFHDEIVEYVNKF
ncbi:MAG: putative HD superfamily hydrolase [Terrestrivirus sp.]|uniref:Putative HD superfamily hydrolase n=1 Tax=Terrestrivirus sp. TaxID=2487775 RepID=A0A3G4ZL46_9VIRU|nr:MAG: putative HD superfamily hydrolase [Terrestrivirus sp.]